jgi:hypothetical protein
MTNPEYAASDDLEPWALIVPRLNWALNFFKVILWPKVNKNQTKSPRNPKRTPHHPKPSQQTQSVQCKKSQPSSPAEKNQFELEKFSSDE